MAQILWGKTKQNKLWVGVEVYRRAKINKKVYRGYEKMCMGSSKKEANII